MEQTKRLINQCDMQKYYIVYPAEKSIEAFLAEELAKTIEDVIGKRLPVVSDHHVTAEHEIRLGKTNRTTLQTENRYSYRIAVVEKNLEIVTDTVFGYDDALTALDTALHDESKTEWKNGDEWTGSVSNAPVIPAEYDLCLLYHNILGYLPWYPALNRAEMGLEIYREYMPDIIGLQEVSKFYYADTIKTVRELESLGYEEIRFPRYGYGNPIYYNAEKLMLLECGYKTARPGDKGTTWSVFEIKRSGGKTFAVMNSHFAADSNAPNHDPVMGNVYRTEDAKTLVQVVEMTKQRYPGIPIFTGGDYNAALGSDPINAAQAGGLVCIRDTLQDHTYCDFCAYNGYPGYDKDANRYHYEAFHLRPTAHNIDFVMLAGAQAGVQIQDYVILKDRISCTVSDHLPHLCHITLPTPSNT